MEANSRKFTSIWTKLLQEHHSQLRDEDLYVGETCHYLGQ